MFSMFRRMSYLLSFVVLLSLGSHVAALDIVNWSDADPADHLWSTPNNWQGGKVPNDTNRATIQRDMYQGEFGPTIAKEGAISNIVYVGRNSLGDLTVDGGTLTTVDWVALGDLAGADGIMNMISGTVTIGSALFVGRYDTGTLNMTGGTITVPTLYIATYSESTGHVNLDGGVISAGNFVMRNTEGAVGTMDVRAGTLISDGNDISPIQEYIDNGWITAYDGDGTLQLDYDVTNKGKTTLKAVHMLDPIPADGGVAAPGQVELSWTLPDPCMAGVPVLVDVYFTDDWDALYTFVDPASIQVVSKQNVTSAVVQTQAKTRYYWAVDTYIGDPNDPILGPIFSFVSDNSPPKVYAGTDLLTWLEEGASTESLNLDGTVTDDGVISPYIVQWTVVSEPDDPGPDAVIADPSAEDTSITVAALGEYVLQLEASDGEYISSDTVTINVYNDGCEAAQSLPDYVPLTGDLNGDCRVDDLDLAILQEDWLKDNSLTKETE